MTETVLTVPDISCERTVKGALEPLEGVQQVRVDIPAKQVHVSYDPDKVSMDRMQAVLAEEDYPVESVE